VEGDQSSEVTIPVGTNHSCQAGSSTGIDMIPLPTIPVMTTDEIMNEHDPLAYVFGSTQVEQQRLLTQAREFQQQAHWLLDRIGIQSGWRVIDMGCGPLGILDSLSQRVGERGHVAGLEYVPRFAEMASAEIVRLGLTNARVIQADALASGLDRNSFDFAHERLVMINRPNPEAILSEMVALVRDDGIVAVQEVDDASWLCYPSHPSWDVLLEVYHSAFGRHGGNVFLGRRLPEMLRSVGLEDVQCKIHVDIVQPHGSRRKHLLALLASLHDKVISLGLLAVNELAAHKAALALHLDDPNTIVIDKLLVQAWGRKPPGRTPV
jgi:SAM-dependent methyltransferase